MELIVKKRFGKYRTALISAVLSVSVSAAMLGGAVTASASTVSQDQSKLQSYQSKLSDNKTQLSKLQSQIDSMKSQKDQQIQLMDAYDQQLALYSSNISTLQDQIDTLQQTVDQESAAIGQDQQNLTDGQAQFADIMRQAQDEGDSNTIMILLGSTSISDLISRMETVGEILAYNQGVMNGISQDQAALQSDIQSNQSSEQDLQDSMSQLQSEQAAMNAKAGEAQTYLDQLNSSLEGEQALYDQEAKDNDSIQSQIAQMTAQIKADQAAAAAASRASSSPPQSAPPPSVNGQLGYPLPASHESISSPFGPRSSPITGAYEIHDGIDLPAPRDTPIYAAADGQVVIAGPYYTYGNCVVILSSGGLSTLYAHQDNGAIRVTVGENVTKGEQIGAVGMTGAATGYHLHFGVSVNGKWVNPVQYFPEIGFSYIDGCSPTTYGYQ